MRTRVRRHGRGGASARRLRPGHDRLSHLDLQPQRAAPREELPDNDECRGRRRHHRGRGTDVPVRVLPLASASQCQGGSPRFDVVVGTTTYFLGCNNVTPTTNADGTVTYTFTADTIAAAGNQVPVPTGAISSMDILIDVQGTADVSQITVNGKLQKPVPARVNVLSKCEERCVEDVHRPEVQETRASASRTPCTSSTTRSRNRTPTTSTTATDRAFACPLNVEGPPRGGPSCVLGLIEHPRASYRRRLNRRSIWLFVGTLLLLLGSVLVFRAFDSHSHSASDTLRPFVLTMAFVWALSIAAARIVLRYGA